MSIRGLEVIVAALLIGTGLGFVVGVLLEDDPITSASAAPIPASSPAFPIDPPPQVLPDPTNPPLASKLPTHAETIGVAPYDLTFPIPNGWDEFQIGPAEKRWTLPGNPPNNYSVRVEMVISQRTTIEALRDQRAGELEGLLGFTVVERGDDMLVFTYVDPSQHQRLSVIRWISPLGSGTAEAEVAATGRMRDEDGLRALVTTISEGAS